jgi:hypothetical protein
MQRKISNLVILFHIRKQSPISVCSNAQDANLYGRPYNNSILMNNFAS